MRHDPRLEPGVLLHGPPPGLPHRRSARRTTSSAPRRRDPRGSGKQPSDPDRIYRNLRDITETDDPPLHLLLGKGTAAVAQDLTDRLAIQNRPVRHVSESA